jgi:hypothetical protein
MIARYRYLSRYPKVFQSMTGLKLNEFNLLLLDVLPRLHDERTTRLSRPDRLRGMGGGAHAELDNSNQILLAIIWLRLYPTHEVLAYFFDVSDSTVSRVINRVVPLLAASGRDTMRMPDPGRKHRRQLDQLMSEIPELAVLVDSFEQRVQRHKDREEADRYYSGKKKQHTLKSQLSIDAQTGLIVHVSQSVVGPTSDLKLLEQSGLAKALPKTVKVGGDLGYVGIEQVLPGQGFTPRRKPRGKPRPAEDITYNTAFSGVRIEVEHSIGRVRRYQALSQTDRNHRKLHQERVEAASGLANRQIKARLLYYRLAA